MNGRPDAAALVAGIAIAALGAVLLADALSWLTLSFAGLGPIVLAAVGATFLASGLSRRD